MVRQNQEARWQGMSLTNTHAMAAANVLVEAAPEEDAIVVASIV